MFLDHVLCYKKFKYNNKNIILIYFQVKNTLKCNRSSPLLNTHKTRHRRHFKRICFRFSAKQY